MVKDYSEVKGLIHFFFEEWDLPSIKLSEFIDWYNEWYYD